MRHAAPAGRRPLGRAAQLGLAAITYTTASLATGLITLGATLAVWGLWQWLEVN